LSLAATTTGFVFWDNVINIGRSDADVRHLDKSPWSGVQDPQVSGKLITVGAINKGMELTSIV